jgi:hypothetical protein
MLRKIISLVFVFLLSLGLSACEKTPPRILGEPGVTRLNGEQARAHISGNTEKWVEGTGYYNPNGEMEMIWRKAKVKGVWEVSDDGEVCLNVKNWKPLCHYYVNNNGAITMIAEGRNLLVPSDRNRGVREILEGKKLPRI